MKNFVTLTQDETFNLPISFHVDNFGYVEKGGNGQGLVTLSKPCKTFWTVESHDEVLRRVAKAKR